MITRRELIEKEAQRLCLASGYTLDRSASDDRRFRHDDMRPWWDAMFSHRVAHDIEKLEHAGFTVLP